MQQMGIKVDRIYKRRRYAAWFLLLGSLYLCLGLPELHSFHHCHQAGIAHNHAAEVLGADVFYGDLDLHNRCFLCDFFATIQFSPSCQRLWLERGYFFSALFFLFSVQQQKSSLRLYEGRGPPVA